MRQQGKKIHFSMKHYLNLTTTKVILDLPISAREARKDVMKFSQVLEIVSEEH